MLPYPEGFQRYTLTNGDLVPEVIQHYYSLPLLNLGTLMGLLSTQDNSGYTQYLTALQSVGRWKSGDSPVKTFKGENVLEHVASGVHLIGTVMQLFPELARVADLQKAADYFFLHDGGEIAVDDMANTDPRWSNLNALQKTQLQAEKEAKEQRGFETQVVTIFGTNFQSMVSGTYLQYEQRVTLAAHFAKWIDVIVGNRIALDRFYPERTHQSAERILTIALAKFYATSQIVLNKLRDKIRVQEDPENVYQEAVRQFLILVGVYQQEFVRCGYRTEVESYRENYPQLVGLLNG